MRSKSFIMLAALLLLSFTVVTAQEGKKPQLIVPLASGGFVGFKIETVLSDPQKVSTNLNDINAAIVAQVLVDDNNIVHRVLVDSDGAFIFGYDLVVEPVNGSRQFKVSVKPLSPEFERQLRARQTGGGTSAAARPRPNLSVSTLPRPTDAQIIDDGDAFALDLLVNPQTGVKIVDVVKASFDRSRIWESPPVPAQDFTLDNVELAVRDYRLLINGELIAGGRPTRGCAGSLVWFYVPERGRFIFSLTPRVGYSFQKVSVIEDNKISFTLNGDSYEWISSAPIVGSGGNWNLWVLYDASYVPPGFLFSAPSTANARAENQPLTLGTPQSTATLSAGQISQLATNFDRLRNGLPISPSETQPLSQSTSQTLRPPKRAKVVIGSADRMENLLPQN